MNDQNFVEAYRAKNTAQAFVIRQALEEAGIAVMVENDLLQGVVGELPIGWATAPRILVEGEDLARARAIIECSEGARATAVTDEDATACLACGAEMPEGSETCPACGWSYEKD